MKNKAYHNRNPKENWQNLYRIKCQEKNNNIIILLFPQPRANVSKTPSPPYSTPTPLLPSPPPSKTSPRHFSPLRDKEEIDEINRMPSFTQTLPRRQAKKKREPEILFPRQPVIS